MRILAATTFAFLMILGPRSSAAHAIFAPLVWGPPYGESELTFGLEGYHLVAGFHTLSRDGVALSPTIFGRVTVQAEFDSLSSFQTTDGHQNSLYRFGPGLITIDAYWESPFGSTPDGHFEAPLVFRSGCCPLVVQVDETTRRAPNLSVRGLPGVFDEAFREALLMNSGENFGVGLILNNVLNIDGDATSGVRTGTFNPAGRPGLGVQVPEPGVTALLLVASGWFLRRRRANTDATRPVSTSR